MSAYVTDDCKGDGWHLMLGDSCERLGELETNTVDFSIYSPPFDSLYVYSPTERDIGNSATRSEFLAHYRFVIDEVFRTTKPGRLTAVHVAQVPTTKANQGVTGLTDFRGGVIAQHVDAGWIFHGEITVDKDPQAQAIRTKSQALLFVQLERDSSMSRPALADYVLLFRKPGKNQTPIVPDVTREKWIQWASPIWDSPESPEDDAILATIGLQRCWYGIRESTTLNYRSARENADERHICPLQLPLIKRCIKLWSNPGELVLSPFAGIGSEGYVSIETDRRFVGCELKASYWKVATENLQAAEYASKLPTLLDSTP